MGTAAADVTAPVATAGELDGGGLLMLDAASCVDGIWGEGFLTAAFWVDGFLAELFLLDAPLAAVAVVDDAALDESGLDGSPGVEGPATSGWSTSAGTINQCKRVDADTFATRRDDCR
jgi:hypothetical protein